MPEQLEALRQALVAEAHSDKVVIIVDELDRCPPDYALAFLEATKTIFNAPGYVFCLMVNAGFLETIAKHRFGDAHDDEKYLDKFVDLRLRLNASEENFLSAVKEIAKKLPLAIATGFSMRKVERVLLKVEIALRCYPKTPLNASLLVFMAFDDAIEKSIPEHHLPRSKITPDYGSGKIKAYESKGRTSHQHGEKHKMTVETDIRDTAPELLEIPEENYSAHPAGKGHERAPWYRICAFFCPQYMPSHRMVLDAFAEIMPDTAY